MFTGSMVALVTPFNDGKVDWQSLENLIEFHIQNGTRGIVPCGTTGESATLSHEEHDAVVKTVVNTVNKRVPVIAGTGSNSTAEAVRLTRAAEKSGADGALMISPYYNRPTQEGIYQHYRKVALKSASRSSFTIFRAAPARRSSRKRWRVWPKSITSPASRKPRAQWIRPST